MLALPDGNHHDHHPIIEYLIHQPESGGTKLDLVAVEHTGMSGCFDTGSLETSGQAFLELLPDAVVEFVPFFQG
jgi:hypothetical protein